MNLSRIVHLELSAQRRRFLVAAGVAAVALIGFVHYWSGPQYEFHIFYLLPVVAVSWYVGLQAGVAVSLLSVLSWLMPEWLVPDPEIATVVFNEIVRLLVLLVVSYLAASLRTVLRREAFFARLDPLTGLANRRLFHEEGDAELNRVRRHHFPLTVVFIDLDNFKAVNDSLGHATGDDLLREVAQALREHTRTSDIVSRLGGDEFAILMPDTDCEAALAGVDKVHRQLLAAMARHGWPVTFSIGVVTCIAPPQEDFKGLIDRADTLMYEVKRAGKNTIRHQVIDA
ncbi:MAG TPA: GGDEF domain-containing protein [Rhodocyclaceae bacterium]|nr:GGDEF domain-containing protein [Rhodocyclaceae bacterium]